MHAFWEQSGMDGVAYWDSCLSAECLCVYLCVYVCECVRVCVYMGVHCAHACVGFSHFKVTAENTSVWVVATTHCIARILVVLGIISGHKFISTVDVGVSFSAGAPLNRRCSTALRKNVVLSKKNYCTVSSRSKGCSFQATPDQKL